MCNNFQEIDTIEGTFEIKKQMIIETCKDICNPLGDCESIMYFMNAVRYMKKYEIFQNDETMASQWKFFIFDMLTSFHEWNPELSVIKKENFTDTLHLLFKMKGVDLGVIMSDMEVTIETYLRNPVQYLCQFYNEQSFFMETVFSTNFVVIDPNIKKVMLGSEKKKQTLAYNLFFNQIVDTILESGYSDNLELHRSINIDVDDVCTKIPFDFLKPLLDNTTVNPIDLKNINLLVQCVKEMMKCEVKPEVCLIDADAAQEAYSEQFDADDVIERHTIEYIHSLSYTCVKYSNLVALKYLIASGKDPEVFFRSTEEDYIDDSGDRNSFEHCFTMIDCHMNYPHVIKELVEMKKIIMMYMQSPSKTITKMRNQIKWMSYHSACVFSMTKFCNEGVFKTADQSFNRFISISSKLPPELQMIIACRSQNCSDDYILSKHVNESVGWIMRYKM